jgi:hypothetical protein
MDEAKKFPDTEGRTRARRASADDRTAITSTPTVRTHPTTVEQTAAAAGSAVDSGVESATQHSSEKGNGSDSGIVGRVRERAGAQLSTQKDLATEGIGTIARAVRQTTHELREQKHDTMAEYVERAADQLERMSAQLKNKDVGEMFRDAQNLARRNPVAFVGSAFALGLLGARFFKSSAPENGEHTSSWQRAGGSGSGSSTSASRGSGNVSNPTYTESSAYGSAVAGRPMDNAVDRGTMSGPAHTRGGGLDTERE